MTPTDSHSRSSIDDCRIIDLPRRRGDNGNLTEVENSGSYPFAIKRVYYIYDVPADSERGGHSHYEAESLLVAVSGAFSVTIDDGCSSRTVRLDRPYQALYLSKGIWRTLHGFSAGSVCLVLSSEPYSAADYVRSYEQFRELTACKRPATEVKHPFLDLGTVNAPYFSELKQAACRVIESGHYIGGAEVEALESELGVMVETPHVVGVSNGLDALRLIFRAYIEMGRLRPGDEVIVPSNTFVATILAITDSGLTPVLVDPDPDTAVLTAEGVEAAITPRTRAVALVHLYGRACWSSSMRSVAETRGLLVVEDNAQAIGARASESGLYGTHATGSLGHAGAISFYPTKNVGALGDAGAITTHDADLAQVARALRNYGTDKPYHNLYAGLNCRLDPIQAAMLRVKIKHLGQENAHRQRLATIYDECITNERVTLPPLPTANVQECVWHQYVVRVADRDTFRAYLLEQGVDTGVHYPTPPHRQPCYSQWSGLHLPIADQLAAEVVSLPISTGTSEADARAIAAIINSYA